VQHLGARRDGAFQDAVEVFTGGRHREVHLLDGDLVAARALVPRRQHAAVVLFGRDDLIAGLEVDAVLRYLQRLARIARNGHLFGVAAELLRQAAAHDLDVPLDQAAVIDRRLVRIIEVALVGLVHDRGARAAVAVVEIDHRPIERERALDVAPVTLVLGDVVRRPIAERAGRLGDQFDAVVIEDEGGRAGGAANPQE
jgi:hypothetical protein